MTGAGVGVADRLGGALHPERRFAAVTALALALGALLRVAFLWRKPFWADEAWVAYLVDKPFGEMLATIPRTTAPAGFALAVKLTALLPGLPPEITLRLLPLAAGIATLALVPAFVRGFGASRRAAAIAVTLAAALPALVHYSRELKPYAVDVLIATAFPLVALRLFAAASPGAGAAPTGRGRYLPAWLAGAAPLVSFGGVFPVAATIAWGWAHLLRRRITAARRPWAAATAPFLLVPALLLPLVLYRQVTNPVARMMRDDQGFLLNPAVGELGRHLAQLVTTAAGHQFPGLAWPALGFAAIGVVAWPAPGRSAFAAIAGGSVLLAAVAAAAGFYIVGLGRLVLFTAPFFLAAVAVGIDRSFELLARRPAWRPAASAAALLLAGSLAGFWSYRTAAHYLRPERPAWESPFLNDNFRDVRGLVAETARRRLPGEPVLVGRGLANGFRYYSRGRLPGARSVPARGRNVLRATLVDWLPTVGARGWVLLQDGDAAAVRHVVAQAGCSIRGEQRFVQAVLWEVTCGGADAAPAPAPGGGRAE